MNIQTNCFECHNRVEFWIPGSAGLCSFCAKNLILFPTEKFSHDQTLDQCPICGCAHLFKQKDFNRTLGLIILLLGIIPAYFTYGISLLIVTLIDWYLYSRVEEVGCCYQCGSVYRSHLTILKLPPFELQLSDYYASLKRS